MIKNGGREAGCGNETSGQVRHHVAPVREMAGCHMTLDAVNLRLWG
jgi:hypothetical protein